MDTLELILIVLTLAFGTGFLICMLALIRIKADKESIKIASSTTEVIESSESNLKRILSDLENIEVVEKALKLENKIRKSGCSTILCNLK